jgi:hypothetical protein
MRKNVAGDKTVIPDNWQDRAGTKTHLPLGDRMAALIAWALVVHVDLLVKGLRPPEAAALRAALDEKVNTNRMLSKRSRPLSRRHGAQPQETAQVGEET